MLSWTSILPDRLFKLTFGSRAKILISKKRTGLNKVGPRDLEKYRGIEFEPVQFSSENLISVFVSNGWTGH